MIVYHGTTRRRARSIARDGFEPKRPSRRVWFSKNKRYAEQRAHRKAHNGSDRPAVLTVDLDWESLRRCYGSNRVRESGGVISIHGKVPASALRNAPERGLPEDATELARWINGVLGKKDHNGVSARHPGVRRLALWVDNTLCVNPNIRIGEKELLSYAMQWIPEHFEGVVVDFEHLRTWPRAVRTEQKKRCTDSFVAPPIEDRRIEEAMDCLESSKSQRQVRGLKLLAEVGDADLFEWCMILIGDGDKALRLGALKVMRSCELIEPEAVAGFADAADKAIRAAALEVLVLHDEERVQDWFWRGLTDPETHVRLSTAKFLAILDPMVHREVFETALYDPHPQVVQAAEKLVKGKGYSTLVW